MRTATLTTTVLLALLGGAGAAAGDDPLPQGSEPVTLDPATFSTRIDNPYWPMVPGSRWMYRENAGRGRVHHITVTVTNRTRKVAGVTARVVHDRETQGARLVEDTYDWYAQDRDGNIWYLGEDTREYRNGKVVSRLGSWEAGVDGAQAGVIVPAHPRVGMTYRQEYYAGKAEDRARVIAVHGRATVPFGSFDDLFVTKDFTPLEPKAIEHKSYARGVGLVLAVSRRGSREELVRFRRGAG
jgi:hypothetical protein